MASAVASNLPAASSAVSYGWLSPRVSFSREAADDGAVASSPAAVSPPEPAISKDFIDFEFRLGGSATMLPADELFADGKLLPLRPAPAPEPAPPPAEILPAPERMKSLRAAAEASDPYVFSPKAPSCSSRWRELLGLKKVQSPKPSPSTSTTPTAATPARSSNSTAVRSLKLLLQRNNGRVSGAAMSDLAAATLPLLRDSSDSEASLSLSSSRLSLSSSSSSGHDHDDFPRLSLDSVDLKPNPPRIRLVRSSLSSRASRSPVRRPSPATPTATSDPPSARGLSVDSPRMNSSGKIVFQGLERSSSSPGSFHASLKSRSRAMDRSYSANVRVAPVLNVPVCSLRGTAKSGPVFGFGQLFKEKKETARDAPPRSRSALGRKVQAAGVVQGSMSSRDLGN